MSQDNLALEVSYTIFGDLTATADSLRVGGNIVTNASSTREMQSLGLMAEYRFVQTDDYYLFGRGGAHFWASETQVSFTFQSRSVSNRVDDDGIAGAVGAGVGAGFARLGYDFIFGSGEDEVDTHSIYAGAQFEF